MPSTRRGRGATTAFGLAEYHKLLSRLDVEKDAIMANPPISSERIPIFHAKADELFGPMLVTRYRDANLDRPTLQTSLKDSTNYFLELLKRQQVYRPHEFVSEIEGYSDLPLQFANIAPFVKEAVHDSGLSPLTFQPSLCILTNPASFLDPGLRTQEPACAETVGFGTPTILEELAIPHIDNIYATLQNNTCKVYYTYKLSRQVFDSNNPLPYFQGNATKNAWFNTNDTLNHDVANLYILWKELGDTLQAVYARERSEYNLHPHQVCLFTNDIPLTYRCILLHVPACLSKRGATFRKSFHYHPAMNDVKKNWQEAQLRALLDHNQHVMNEINRVIQHGQYYTLDRSIRFGPTSRIARFLEQCIQQIRETTRQFQEIPPDSISLSTYSKTSRLYRACRLFNQRVVNESSQSLFIDPSRNYRIFPRGFGNYLLSIQAGGASRVESGDICPFQPAKLVGRSCSPQRGERRHFQSLASPPSLKYDINYGSPTANAVGDFHNLSSFSSLDASRDSLGDVEITEEIPTYIQKNQQDYTQIDVSKEDEYLPYIYVLHALYNILKQAHSDWSENVLRFRTEDIHAKLVIYFGYSEMPIWSDDFLQTIVNLYDTNRLQLTHSEFADIYTPFANALKEEDWEWELLEAQVEKPNMDAAFAILKPTYKRGKTRKLRKV